MAQAFKFNKQTISFLILINFYFFGVVGILSSFQSWFLSNTPLNLLISVVLLLWNHPKWNNKIILFCIICFLAGIGVEMLGVHTGAIFGEYSYGETLGYKIYGVPVMIGANWLVLVYASTRITNHYFPKISNILKALISAALMVGLDFVIEPIAIRFDFWSWELGHPPLHNYIGWYITAVLLTLYCHAVIPTEQKNRVAIGLYLANLFFFGVLLMFYGY